MGKNLTGLIRGATDSVGSTTPIATIAALRALTAATGPDSPEFVDVDGYYAAGDRGGGRFKCIPGGHAPSATFTVSNVTTLVDDQICTADISSIAGYISVGDIFTSGAPNNTFVYKQNSGTPGGAGSYSFNKVITTGSKATSSDNGATCFVDASSRRFLRQWNGNRFEAAWAGIVPTNADNGQLMGRVPRYGKGIFSQGVYTFTTYPDQTDMMNVEWELHTAVFNCTGALNPGSSLTPVAFSWTLTPWPPTTLYPGSDIEFLGYNSGGSPASTADMVSSGVSPFEGGAIVGQFDSSHGVGFLFGAEGYNGIFLYTAPYYVQPRNFSIGGFYVCFAYNSPNSVFLTGIDQAVLKIGNIGLYYNNNPSFNSGENLTCRRTNFNQFSADGIEVMSAQRWDFLNCSITYNVRAAYCSNQYTLFRGYWETNQRVTSAELVAADQNATIIFEAGNNILNLLGESSEVNNTDVIAFDGVLGVMVFFNKSAYYDPNPSRQFIQATAALQIYGSVTGYNGINYPLCVSPNQCIQPDWNFASGALTFYPGSSGTTNQNSVVHSPQTRAAALANDATLHFATMDVNPGELIFVSMWDKAVGPGGITALTGSMVFTTADASPVTVATTAFSQAPSVPGWHYMPEDLAPNWTNAGRDWTLQKFVFRVPIGASKMTGSFSITGTGNYYVSELVIYRQ